MVSSTWAWPIDFPAPAFLPGIAFLYFERRRAAGPRYTRLAAALQQDPTLLLGNALDNDDNQPAHPPPEGLQLQPSRCSLHTCDDRKL